MCVEKPGRSGKEALTHAGKGPPLQAALGYGDNLDRLAWSDFQGSRGLWGQGAAGGARPTAGGGEKGP